MLQCCGPSDGTQHCGDIHTCLVETLESGEDLGRQMKGEQGTHVAQNTILHLYEAHAPSWTRDSQTSDGIDGRNTWTHGIRHEDEWEDFKNR